MQNRQITISVGSSRKSTNWTNQTLSWSEFAARLQIPQRTTETYQAFMQLSKSEQDNLKDVGGFVGGTLSHPRRKPSNVTGRDLITLDLDSLPANSTNDILDRITQLQCAAVIYSTRKHCANKPRLRVIIPTDRTMTADEYEPAARKVAELIGIAYADPTTFEVARLMYWPSCSSDSGYVYQLYDNTFASVDSILSMYADWHDISSWPQVPGDELTPRRLAAKQEDPLSKHGLVGAFCRTYDIVAAMAAFIPTAYDATADDNRYTYLGGSTTGGAVLYEGGKFLYSHHATDPCSGMLVNAWDMVRLHKFADRDDDATPGTPTVKLPSYLAMQELARSDKRVMAALDQERYQNAVDVFGKAVDVNEGVQPAINWMEKLDRTQKGEVRKTTSNIMLILENDPEIKNKIVLDEFASRGMAMGALPWNGDTEPRLWTDVDSAGMRDYLENRYDVTGINKVEDALSLIAFKHRINQVADYLYSLEWDTKPRIDTLLHDYLGAKQSVYTAAVMRKSLAAAVGRAIKGAVKWDYMPILVGPQGCGKTTFLTKLGKDWYCDSLEDFNGKDAKEIIQGQWIVEVGELTAMNRAETIAVKQFLSKKDDVYRAAYGRHSERYPRRCVFFGTSNEPQFLKDVTGNRRFWPITCFDDCEPTKSVWDDLDNEVDQIWAEAVNIFTLGEDLFLQGEALRLSEEAQERYREVNDKEGLIAEFLEKRVPANWDNMDLGQRRQFLNGNMAVPEALVQRDKICALEIWCECMSGDARRMQRRDSVEINNILSVLPNWKRVSTPRRFGYCGNQRGFERVKS